MSNEFRLSVSKCKTFLDCKAKYKYTYIDKLPRKTWSFHTFGKFCHKVLEDFHNVYINGSQEPYNVIMSKAFKDAVTEYKIDMTPEMKKDCWKIIDQYLRIVTTNKKNNLSSNILACEKNFELLVGGKVILNGMIDRIQLDDDNVIHVCDYKTSKNKKYLKDDFFQLLTYAYIIVSEDPEIKKVRASYILLRHNFEYLTAEFNKDEILKIADKYINYTDLIVNEKDFKPNPTRLCTYCDHVNICPEGRKIADPSTIYGSVEW
jgi:RecB family exonuclease